MEQAADRPEAAGVPVCNINTLLSLKTAIIFCKALGYLPSLRALPPLACTSLYCLVNRSEQLAYIRCVTVEWLKPAIPR